MLQQRKHTSEGITAQQNQPSYISSSQWWLVTEKGSGELMLGNVGLANAAMWIQFTEFHPLFRIMCFFFYIKNLLSIKYSQVF